MKLPDNLRSLMFLYNYYYNNCDRLHEEEKLVAAIEAANVNGFLVCLKQKDERKILEFAKIIRQQNEMKLFIQEVCKDEKGTMKALRNKIIKLLEEEND